MLEEQATLKEQTLPDEEKSLDELCKDIRQVDAEIEEYGIEIERLRVLCLEQGIIDEYNRSNANASEDSEDSGSSRPPRSPPPLPPLPRKPQVRILPPQTT